MSQIIRSLYDNKQKEYSKSSSQQNNEKSKTKQSFKDETDINLILEKYVKTGLINHEPSNPGQYGDFSNVVDYQSACNAVLEVERNFMQLPAQARARFQNDPGQFLEFIQDPKNLEEAQKLGLVELKKSAEPSPALPITKDPLIEKPASKPAVVNSST